VPSFQYQAIEKSFLAVDTMRKDTVVAQSAKKNANTLDKKFARGAQPKSS
jgi:hypothetical protein